MECFGYMFKHTKSFEREKKVSGSMQFMKDNKRA